MNLWNIFLNHKGPPIYKWISYFPIYEKHFSRFVNQSITFIEIGAGLGGSAEMWRKYFGPNATIVSIDNREECKSYETEGINVRIGDQSDKKFLANIIEEFGNPDIILDDGSHMQDHVNITFDFLYSRLANNGVYLVEDLHTAYWKDYKGGLKKKNTFIETTKNLIDQLNAHETRGQLDPTYITNNTSSINIYRSIIAFEKEVIKPFKPLFSPPLEK